MRLWWNHVWRAVEYQCGTVEERRMIELRYHVARAVKRHRRSRRITQENLAARVGIAQATLSRVERASPHVSLDIAVRCLIAMDCTDTDLAAAFDLTQNPGIALLRAKAAQRLAQKPRAPDKPGPRTDGRLLWRRPQRRRKP